MIDAVNQSAADVLWFGQTALNQEKWLHAHRDGLEVGSSRALGAAFDFYVGKLRQGRAGSGGGCSCLRQNYVAQTLHLRNAGRQGSSALQ
jgi:hypothetical protein